MCLIFPQTFYNSEIFFFFLFRLRPQRKGLHQVTWDSFFFFFHEINYYFLLLLPLVLDDNSISTKMNKRRNISQYWSETLKRLIGMDWTESPGRMSAEQNLSDEKHLVQAIQRKEMEENRLTRESQFYREGRQRWKRDGCKSPSTYEFTSFYPLLVFTVLWYVYLCRFGGLY